MRATRSLARHRGWPLAAAALLAGGVQCAPSLDPAGSAAIDEYLDAAVTERHVPGIVALVVDADDVLFAGAYGMQDAAAGVPMARDSIFRIASMTKPITSVCVMMLVEQRRLSLDETAGKYVSALAAPRVFESFDPATKRYTTRPASREVTLRDLITQTSGMGYAWSNEILNALVHGIPANSTVLGLPLLHDPGSRWTYGEGPRVLGTIVERVSGEPFDAFMRQRVFVPLGMKDTGYSVPETAHGRVVTLNTRNADGSFTEVPNAPELAAPARGDGGLYSTADDYAKFLQMLLRGGRASDGTVLLGEDTVRQMGRNQIGDLRVELQPAANHERARPFPLGAGRDTFGFGFELAAPPERPDMRSEGSMSWAGIDNTEFWIDPKRGIAAVLMVQFLPFYDALALETLEGFEQRVYRALD